MLNRISIIIPVYNQAETILKTVKSVINALDYCDEAIFIDDCSIDNSYDILVTACKGVDNIKCLRNEYNRGHIYTLNRAVTFCSNEYVTIIGGDDLLSKGFCSSIRKTINSDDDFIFPPVVSFFNDEEITLDGNKEANRNYVINKFNIGWGWGKYRSEKYSIIGVTVKIETFKKLGGFSSEFIVEDYNMFLQAASEKYKMRLVPCLPSFYRINENSISSKTKVMYKEDIKIIYKYFNVVLFLVLTFKRTISFVWFLIKKSIREK